MALVRLSNNRAELKSVSQDSNCNQIMPILELWNDTLIEEFLFS